MRSCFLWIAALTLLFPLSVADAYAFDNQEALRGLIRAKVICDINVGDPELLLTRMKLIDKTYEQLKSAGVAPEFVLAVRGRASLYLTRPGKYLGLEQKDAQIRMAAWVEHFSTLGFRIEQCALAAAMLDIDPGDFLPAVNVVENGYISLIGYQQQGFALVPMD